MLNRALDALTPRVQIGFVEDGGLLVPTAADTGTGGGIRKSSSSSRSGPYQPPGLSLAPSTGAHSARSAAPSTTALAPTPGGFSRTASIATLLLPSSYREQLRLADTLKTLVTRSGIPSCGEPWRPCRRISQFTDGRIPQSWSVKLALRFQPNTHGSSPCSGRMLLTRYSHLNHL